MDGDYTLDHHSAMGCEGDGLDSLFGDDGDADVDSLFMEDTSVESSHTAASEQPSISSAQERHRKTTDSGTAQLFLPSFGAHVESETRPALSAMQLTLPIVPDPLTASLSHRDGHTSGDTVVSSTQQLPYAHQGFVSLGEVFDDTGLEAHLEQFWDTTYGDDEQAVNPQTERQVEFQADLNSVQHDEAVSNDGGLHDATPSSLIQGPTGRNNVAGNGAGQNGVVRNPNRPDHGIEIIHKNVDATGVILASEIPGYRYAKTSSNQPIRLPRRIDLEDDGRAQLLANYLTVSKLSTPILLDDLLLLTDPGQVGTPQQTFFTSALSLAGAQVSAWPKS